jgi:hypothetical protein
MRDDVIKALRFKAVAQETRCNDIADNIKSGDDRPQSGSR